MIISRLSFAFIVKFVLGLLLWLVAEWSYHAFNDGDVRLRIHLFLLIASCLILIPTGVWQAITTKLKISELLLRVIVHSAFVIAFALLTDNRFETIIYALIQVIAWFIGWMFRDANHDSYQNLLVALGAYLVMVLVFEMIAPSLQAWVITQQQRANQAQSDAVPSWGEIALAPIRAVPAGSPITEVISEGPGPHWGPSTGWGTRTNAVVRRFLPNEFDVTLTYNSIGLRGGEITYEKPADVYRILMIGDSFLEAREVEDTDIVYAQLEQLLTDYRTADGRRIEVIGAGSTGWGTAQAYLYYHHEGYRFDPDLVIHTFIINDVVDNYPAFFYPERGIDFALTDNGVSIIGASESRTITQPISAWLNALPPILQQMNTIKLLRQLFFPPLTPLTVINDVPQSHPQDYIFLRYPQLEGYPLAWERTEQIYAHWAQEVQGQNDLLMVLAVDVGISYIRGVVDRHINHPDWIWDSILPYTRLTAFLDPLDVPVIETRQAYEAYALNQDMLVRDALFLPTDGHWNIDGHRVTAQIVLDTLLAQNIIRQD